jgi:NRPS condensation-like uncharacterized protein
LQYNIDGRFRGCIPQELLRRALAKVSRRYPLTSARFAQDSEGATRFILENFSEFHVRAFDKKMDDEWLNLAWDEQRHPFDLDEGPLVKFLLLTSPHNTDLVVICHHAICDGLSLTYLIKQIVLLLNDPERDVAPLPLPTAMSEDSLSVKVTPGLLDRILINRLNRSWKKEKALFSEHDYTQLYEDYWHARNIGKNILTLSQDTTSAVVSRCHAERVTVNSALMAAFAFAQRDVQGTKESYLRRALVAVNLRHLFKNPPGENLGLFAAGFQVALPLGRGGFWGVARKFNTKIKRLLSDPRKVLGFMAPLNYLDPTIIDATYFVAYSSFNSKAARRVAKRILTASNKPKRSLDVTNLGNVNIENGNLETLFFVPILYPNYEKAIGIVTAGGEMHIVVLHDYAQIGSETVEAFIQKSIDYLKSNSSHRTIDDR